VQEAGAAFLIKPQPVRRGEEGNTACVSESASCSSGRERVAPEREGWNHYQGCGRGWYVWERREVGRLGGHQSGPRARRRPGGRRPMLGRNVFREAEQL